MANETLITISQRTGFSISTVSRVLSGQAEKYRISPATVHLIEEEAKRCNYIPNLLAKGLTTRRTNIIGLLIPSVDNPYFANIASVVIRQARSQGFTTMIVDTMENAKNEQQDVLSLISRKVDGIIIVPCDREPDFLERIGRHNIPIVLIDRYFDTTTLPYVCTDNFRGGYEATKHLIEHGHKRIACIQGVPLFDAKQRTRKGIQRSPQRIRAGRLHTGFRGRFFSSKRISGDETAAQRACNSFGYLHIEQYNSAGCNQSHPGIRTPDSPRHFDHLLR